MLERAVSANDNVKLYSEYTMKTGNLICLLLSLAIVGHVVYALLSESEPPRLVSQGKSYTVKELNNEGYNPPLKTEVEVLCKVDHSTLVRGPKGYQFLVPEGGLEPVVKDLDELNGHYTYNVSKEKLEACMDKELDALLAVAGDYVTGMSQWVTPEGFGGVAHVYEFPHLIAVGNGERFHGARVVTNDFRIVQDIQYYEGGHSENLFGKLPWYEKIACRNLCLSTGMTGADSIWERLLMVLANVFLMGAVVAVLQSIKGPLVRWLVGLPVMYVYGLALMDFYHGMWILVALFLLGGLSMLMFPDEGTGKVVGSASGQRAPVPTYAEQVYGASSRENSYPAGVSDYPDEEEDPESEDEDRDNEEDRLPDDEEPESRRDDDSAERERRKEKEDMNEYWLRKAEEYEEEAAEKKDLRDDAIREARAREREAEDLKNQIELTGDSDGYYRREIAEKYREAEDLRREADGYNREYEAAKSEARTARSNAGQGG